MSAELLCREHCRACQWEQGTSGVSPFGRGVLYALPFAFVGWGVLFGAARLVLLVVGA